MNGSDDNRPVEFIIVKRGGAHDDGHHGGAWKIAFADFMTAMMALFLVLWLVNAANEQTRKAVASYFNPVKLVDRSRGNKGLSEAAGPAETAEEQTAPEPPRPKVEIDLPPTDKEAEELMASDPHGLLDSLASEYSRKAGEQSGRGPDAAADPFAPQYWERQQAGPAADDGEAGQAPADGPDSARFGAPAPDARPSEASAATELATRIETDIGTALKEKLSSPAAMMAGISVSAVDDGVLVRVSDGLTTPMFGIGSAVPSGELVVAMGEIGRVLAGHPGIVRINGHTDGRPFSGGKSDNWQLSAARAHAAYLMLVRGGLEETRVGRISGFADRDLRDKADPNAGANRRIEILLESDQ